MKIKIRTIIWRTFLTISLLLSLLVIIVMGLMFFKITVDLGFLKGGVEASAESALGRKVAIEGPVVLEFSEWPAIEVREIRIANLPDASNPDFLHAGRPGCWQRRRRGHSIIRLLINSADIVLGERRTNIVRNR